MTSPILWSTPSGLAAVLQFAASAVRLALGLKNADPQTFAYEDFLSAEEIVGGPVRVMLPGNVAFAHALDTRTSNLVDQRKIVANKFDDLAPITSDDLQALARRDDQRREQVDLLFVRQSEVAELEKTSSQRGATALLISPECAADKSFLSPDSLNRNRTRSLSWVLCLVWCLCASWGATEMLALTMESAAYEIRTNAADVRRLAMERAERDRELTTVDALAAWGVEAKTIAARMASLQDLSAATPNDAWWVSVELAGTSQTVSGRSPNAARVLQKISQTFPEKSMSFAEPVIDEGKGQQNFVIQLETIE
ncbi:MAG: hypothetical protein AAFY34_09820 [Pseudomonadota bacterium]